MRPPLKPPRRGARPPVCRLPERARCGEEVRIVETSCALRLCIDSWRWEGVPWYLRSGKYLADTATEVLVGNGSRPRSPDLFADSAATTGLANYLRFRLSPVPPWPPFALCVSCPGKELSGASNGNSIWLEEQLGGIAVRIDFLATPWPAMGALLLLAAKIAFG